VDHIQLALNKYLPVADSCEHGYEASGSIKEGEFLDWLSDC
jgi:hypothetical protein